MVKYVHFHVKKRLIFELQNVAVGLSSAAGLSSRLALSPISLTCAEREGGAKRNIVILEPI